MAATPRAFTQGGKWHPRLLILALLYMAADAGRRSYRGVIEALWGEARALRLKLPRAEEATAPAFCNARPKLHTALMGRLVQTMAKQASTAAGESGKWKGRRLLAIDGSKIALRRSEELQKTFGGPTGSHFPQMLAMVLFDVVLGIAVQFLTASYRGSERTEMRPLLDHVCRGAVLLLDRGFEAFELFCRLRKRGIDFVVRCRARGGFKAIERFVRSGLREAWIMIDRPRDCPPWTSKQLRLRAVRCELKNGRLEVLLTTLGLEFASAQEIEDVYWKRWRIELYFRELKARWFSPLQFHSETPAGVEQEFGAQVLFTAIAASLIVAAGAKHGVPFEEISRKAVLLGLEDFILRLGLFDDLELLERELAALLAQSARRRYKKRPGRSYPRVSYAPGSKWGPNGNNGTHRNGRTR